MAPMRRLRSPLTTRQTAANQSRSLANSSESGASVCSVVSEYGMPYCFRLLQALHLAAEAVAAVGDGHLAGGIGRRLDQHRHVEVGQAQGVGDAALVAEVRQRDDDAVDLVAVAS